MDHVAAVFLVRCEEESNQKRSCKGDGLIVYAVR